MKKEKPSSENTNMTPPASDSNSANKENRVTRTYPFPIGKKTATLIGGSMALGLGASLGDGYQKQP